MIDPDRLGRVHVVNMRLKDGKFFVVLSDGCETSWGWWLNGGMEELRRGPKIKKEVY